MNEYSCPLEHTIHARHCSLLEYHKKEFSVHECQYQDECRQIHASLETIELVEVD